MNPTNESSLESRATRRTVQSMDGPTRLSNCTVVRRPWLKRPGANDRPKVCSRFREAVPDYLHVLSEGDWGRVEPDVADIFQRWADRWSHLQLRAISLGHIKSYLENLQQRGFSTRHIEKEKVLLRSFFRWAQRSGWTDRNPTDNLPHTRPPSEQSTRPWSPVQQYLLLEACRGKFIRQRKTSAGSSHVEKQLLTRAARVPRYLHPLVLLALRTGLRFNDVVNLQWQHVDFKNDRIRIPEDAPSRPLPIDIPMASDVREILQTILRDISPLTPNTDKVLQALGLPTWKGAPDEREILHAFRIVLKKAGVPPGDFNTLRVSFVYNCARAGVPRDAAARMCAWDGGSKLLSTIYIQSGGRPS